MTERQYVEKLKPIEEFAEPDKRNRGLVKSSEGRRPITHRDFYATIERIKIADSVPAEIRSYLNMVKNVYLHGWYYYPLLTHAGFLSLFAIEMALRERFKEEDPKRTMPFRTLFELAVDRGFIKAGEFSRVRERWEESKKLEEETGGLMKAYPQTEKYCRVLAEHIPALRNAFAHPKMTLLFLPGPALRMVRTSCELISQLYEERGE